MRIVFGIHVKERLDLRKILEEEVIEAIRFPFLVVKKQGKYFYQKRLQRGKIEVCCELRERDIKVITVYWI
ncbi:DUF4258 domain-containing protein [Candidatus Woesearchaeota archaeon]|nr:DUF4258 domain-containing protein [Candidatus Woesearchaeota archaeon]